MEVGHNNPTSAPNQRKLMAYTNVRYSLMLNDKQLEALSDGKQKINRMMCLHTMLKLAGMEKTVVTKKGFSGETQIGQFTIEMEKLGELIGADKKTAERIVADFVRLGLIEKTGNNRTTIITMKCLSVWFCDGQPAIKNPFFNFNPSVLPKMARKVYPRKKCVPPDATGSTTIRDPDSECSEHELDETQSALPITNEDARECSKVVAHDKSDSSFSLLSNDDEKEADAMEVQQGCAEPHNHSISDEDSPFRDQEKQIGEHSNTIACHQSLSSSTSCEVTTSDRALLATESGTEGK